VISPAPAWKPEAPFIPLASLSARTDAT
jgi:hypothetical protein